MDISFFDWSMLATFGGALVAVAVLTELLKAVPGVCKVPPQLLSWALAFVVIILAQLFTGTLDVSTAVISLLNSALVSLASNGGYDAIKKLIGKN